MSAATCWFWKHDWHRKGKQLQEALGFGAWGDRGGITLRTNQGRRSFRYLILEECSKCGAVATSTESVPQNEWDAAQKARFKHD